MTDRASHPRLTLEDVEDRVREIAEVVGDDEMAHEMEDDLYETVLTAIAGGWCDDPVSCAGAALETLSLDFDRWYA